MFPQVTAVLSVPLLDAGLLLSLPRRLRCRFVSQDLVFLENYKPVRVTMGVHGRGLPTSICM
jgi:hypothetical protein